jgi:hypothetical protein
MRSGLCLAAMLVSSGSAAADETPLTIGQFIDVVDSVVMLSTYLDSNGGYAPSPVPFHVGVVFPSGEESADEPVFPTNFLAG